MDSEQEYVTTETAVYYHASEDCPALKRGQNAALTNGWQQHPLVPYTPESGMTRKRCTECVK